MLVSAVTIVALAVLLSPYILVAGAVFGLVYGLPQLPAPFNALVPAPVVEVCDTTTAGKTRVRAANLTPGAGVQAEHKIEQFTRFLRVQSPARISPGLVERAFQASFALSGVPQSSAVQLSDVSPAQEEPRWQEPCM